jgi:hypothetical protein
MDRYSFHISPCYKMIIQRLALVLSIIHFYKPACILPVEGDGVERLQNSKNRFYGWLFRKLSHTASGLTRTTFTPMIADGGNIRRFLPKFVSVWSSNNFSWVTTLIDGIMLLAALDNPHNKTHFLISIRNGLDNSKPANRVGETAVDVQESFSERCGRSVTVNLISSPLMHRKRLYAST